MPKFQSLRKGSRVFLDHLKVFDVLFPADRDGLVTIPNMSIGGWGGWQYAVGSSMLLRNAGGEQIRVYCLLDSDYHTPEQKKQRLDQARLHDVELHIWRRKEIENYFLIPAVIQRLIESKLARRTAPPSIEEIAVELEKIAELQKNDVFDGLSAEMLSEDRGLGGGGANKKARALLDDLWLATDDRIAAISGKAALAKLSRWSHQQFGVSITARSVARAMWPKDVPVEMSKVVTAIAECKRLSV